MGFNIRNQNGGVINNVDGNMIIRGGQNGQAPSIGDVRQAVADLRNSLEITGLNGADYQLARKYLDDLDAEVGRSEPDRKNVADRLTRLTSIVTAAGAFAGLAEPIQTIVGWLGSLGQPIVKLLGAS